MARTQRKQRTRGVARKAAPATPLQAVRANARKVVSAVARMTTQRQRAAVALARDAREAVLARAGEAKSRTAEAVTQLERVFEDRVERVVAKLGVPTARDVRALSRQVAHLQQSVDQLRRSRARA